MWDRTEFKYQARKLLKGTYINAIIVSFVMLLASGDWITQKNQLQK